MRVTKRVTNGRHRPTSGMPLGRIMAAMMLASLISTLFAIPALATPGDLGVSTTSAPANGANVKVGTPVVYTITVTNTDAGAASVASSLTDNVGTGVYVSDNSGGACLYAMPVLTCPVPIIVASGTWSVQVTVNAPPAAGPLTNIATLPADTDGANNSSTNTTNAVLTLGDVTIAKSHVASATTPGSDVTYTLTVTNGLGSDPALGVSVSDTLAASLTFKSSASGCTAVAQVVTCAGLPPVVSGTPQSVSFIATIGAAVPSGTVIANTATVSTTTPESNSTNNTSNSDSLTVSAASIDMAVTLSANPTTVAPGDTVTFTVGAQNLSATNDATNVVVTDTLPTGLTAVAPPTAPSVGTVALAGNVWTWTIPTVAKGATLTTTFDVTVDVGTTLTTIDDSASLTATQTDPVSTNNTATATLTITAAVADLNLLSAVDDAKPNKGDKIQIGIQVSNAGPADATNVVVKDVLASGLKFNSCTGCSPSGLRRLSSQQFSIASIPANSSATIVLNVTVQASSGTLKNTASVLSADQSDPNGANDQDTLNITIGGTNNSGGGGSGSGTGTSGSGSGTSGSGGTTAFTGFTANQLLPWLMLFATLGLVALEFSRRRPAVAAVGHSYGFDPWV